MRHRMMMWITLVCLTAASVASAQGAPVGGGMGGGPMGGPHFGGGPGMGMGMEGRPFGPPDRRMLEKLGLTGAHLDKAQAIFEAHERSAIQARADMETAHLDMRNLMRADNPDRGVIGAQIDKIEHLQAEMRKSATWAMLDVRALLTPQQRKELERMRPGPGDRRGDRGRGPEGHGPGGDGQE